MNVCRTCLLRTLFVWCGTWEVVCSTTVVLLTVLGHLFSFFFNGYTAASCCIYKVLKCSMCWNLSVETLKDENVLLFSSIFWIWIKASAACLHAMYVRVEMALEICKVESQCLRHRCIERLLRKMYLSVNIEVIKLPNHEEWNLTLSFEIKLFYHKNLFFKATCSALKVCIVFHLVTFI